MVIERQERPLNCRLFVQPIIATILAIRAGFREARVGNPSFLSALLSHPGHRLALLRASWKDVGMVFGTAIVIDAAYQICVFHWIYPLQVLIVAPLLSEIAPGRLSQRCLKIAGSAEHDRIEILHKMVRPNFYVAGGHTCSYAIEIRPIRPALLVSGEASI